MGITNFNGSKRVDFEVNTDGWNIVKLSSLTAGAEYQLKGFIPTKEGKFGAGVLFISDGQLVGVPNRYREIALEMMKDVESVEQIKTGKAYFKYSLVPNDKGNDTQLIEFVLH